MDNPHRIDENDNIPHRLLNVRIPWADFQPERFTELPCVLCGSRTYEIKASIVINWIEFHLVQCSKCSLIWRTPLPDAAFLNNLYSEAYYNVKEHCPGLEYQVGIADTHPADQEIRRNKSNAEVKKWVNLGIKPTDELGNKRKLLEIGGGRGYLQLAASKEGWNTLGLEISPHGIKEAIHRGLMMLPILLENMCSLYLPYDRYFDLVVFFDFIEHISDPGRVLRMIRHSLADEGMIILRTPNTKVLPMLHLIDHIWHFSESTLIYLLNKESFQVMEIQESGIFREPHGNIIENITVFAKKL